MVVYLGFSIRVAIGTRKNSRARLLLAALLATVVWAALCLPIGLAPSSAGQLAADIADVVRYGAWYLFLWDLMREKESESGRALDAPSIPHSSRSQPSWWRASCSASG